MYVIYSSLPINYASIIFSFIGNHHLHKFLPFGCFLTKIFQHFGIPLANETSIRQKELFTSASLLRMQIPRESSDHTMSVYNPPLTIEVDDSDEELSSDDVDPRFRKEVLECLDRVEASQHQLLQEFQTMQLTQA